MRVCVEWGRALPRGGPPGPALPGLPWVWPAHTQPQGLPPRATLQGCPWFVQLAESSSWQGRVRFMVKDCLQNLLLPFLSFYPCLAPRVVLWIF